MAKPAIKNNLWWFVPALAAVVITALVSANGVVGTVGGVHYVECPPGSEGQDANIISYKDSEPITGTCGAAEATDYVPNSFFIPASSDIGKLLLITPVFSATIAMLFMRAGWKRFKDDPDRQNEAMEARSLCSWGSQARRSSKGRWSSASSPWWSDLEISTSQT